MKKFAFAVALASALGASSALAVDDAKWGAWASTDDDALLRILAADHNDGAPNQPSLGTEDSALMDAGSLLGDLLTALSETSGLSLQDLLDPANLGALNDTLGSLPVDLPVGGSDLGSTIDDTIGGTVGGICGVLGAAC